ncbi:MAG: EamA/RhaT family transporter [Gammaproteobacteria bacterium]|nr:MAG: EamA/RhaT family transporter [Gammaproteobacteria bacterium]RKZ71991.1 MAG: EamA/RhaT family transporter [Gammaproteobacteria bacterium]
MTIGEPYNLPRAALATTLAALMFASMGVAVRYASTSLSSEVMVFLRNSFGLLFLLPWLYHSGFNGLKTNRLSGHVTRSVAGLAAMYCFFYAIAHLPLAEAVLLNFSSPIFTAIIALLWLGEEATRKLILAIFIGFAGICLILKPGMGILSTAALVGLVSAVFAALAMVTIRNLSKTEPTRRIVFYFSITATLISAVPMFWYWQTPDLKPLLAMVFAGLAATLGQLLLTHGYSLAPAARVSPYSYNTIIFAAIYGWIFWSETPDILTLFGALLIICAGIITLLSRPTRSLTEPD